MAPKPSKDELFQLKTCEDTMHKDQEFRTQIWCENMQSILET